MGLAYTLAAGEALPGCTVVSMVVMVMVVLGSGGVLGLHLGGDGDGVLAGRGGIPGGAGLCDHSRLLQRLLSNQRRLLFHQARLERQSPGLSCDS